jgi:hypothetical protein
VNPRYPVRRGVTDQLRTALEYWIARSSRATTAVLFGERHHDDGVPHATFFAS